MGENKKFPPSIGIDLGTTYSCAAVLQRGQVEVIPNDQGGRLTPSCVAFTGDQRLIGEAAVLQMVRNPENTVFDVKRLVGRPYNDPSVQADKKRWAFNLVNREGKPKISVTHGERREFLPEEISATVLQYMKKISTDFIGKDISSAVITVPAYFNDSQRRATKDAAEIAGLHVLGILNEPTSAAIAYGLENKTDSSRNVLIFDLGGGTFDVTVLTIDGGLFDVKSTAGDTHLGGQDFNDRLYNHFVAVFSQKTGLDLTKNARSKYKLRAECEKAKKMLSAKESTSFYIDSLYNGEDFDARISRATFEQLNHDLFTATLETVETALENAHMDKDMIDDVVLVGGSTRIPYIKILLKEYFGEQKICENVNPDEAVACGAAMRAAFLSGEVSTEMKNFQLKDVTPLSLGVEVRGKEMAFVIMRNTKIPAKKWEVYKTSRDFQTTVPIRVFEGERTMTKLNNFLGSFDLHDIPALKAGEAKIHVCFDVDSNGVLEVSGIEKTTGNEKKITIKQDTGRLKKDDIRKMIADVEKFRVQDQEWKVKKEAMDELENFANDTKYHVESIEGKTTAEKKKNEYVAAECEELLEWTEDNKKAQTVDFKKKKEDLKKKLAVLYPEKNW